MKRIARRNPLLPSVDYQDAQHGYFIHSGKVYPVGTAPAHIFKAAVIAKVSHLGQKPEYGPILRQRDMDLHDRWYILNGLAEREKGMTLYASRGEAERECRQVG